jgi:hypothetical protein
VLAQERESADAEEGEPRDAEVGGEVPRPRVAEVRDHARRVRRVIVGRAEAARERGAEALLRAEVVDPEARRHLVDVVGVGGEALGRAVERDLYEPHGQAGVPGEVDGRADAPRVGRRDDDAGDRAVGGQEEGRVGRRDQVSLGHQRDEHEVRLGVTADVVGSHIFVVSPS